MKNKGYTLAEILVVLIILAAISTITISSASKMMPDKNKVNFKKSYSELNTAVRELLNDNSLYPEHKSNDPNNPDKYAGFRASAISVDVPGTYFNGKADKASGGEKFARLLAAKLNALAYDENDSGYPCDDGVNVCVLNNNVSSNEYIYTKGSGARVQFTTPNGVVWEVGTKSFRNDDNIVAIDTNGSNAPNCSFDDEGCTSPDRFSFIVRYDGNISFANEQEKEYVSSTKITHDD